VKAVSLPMMTTRGWGIYFRDVLELRVIHWNFPTRFDQQSIIPLFAGSPSGRYDAVHSLLGHRALKRIPSLPVEG